MDFNSGFGSLKKYRKIAGVSPAFAGKMAE
jgi:hypothetical protein